MILSESDWRNLPWHVDHRCSGCDYLGYKWSTEEDAAAAIPSNKCFLSGTRVKAVNEGTG